MSTEIYPVRTARERNAFATFPWRIYRDDPLWVPPLVSERVKAIDPDHGSFFERGEAEGFIARRDGRPSGTICLAEDVYANELCSRRECMFGFFECTDDPEVAEALFDEAIEWAQARDLDTLVGPLNLEYVREHGALIDGRDRPPALFCAHTPPYYPDLLEGFGFRPLADSLAYAVRLDASPSSAECLERAAAEVRSRGWLTVREADLDHWEDEVQQIHTLHESTDAHLPGHLPWDLNVLRSALEAFRELADPELILFAEEGRETVGCMLGIRDLNEALRHANGLRYPWHWARLGPRLRRQPECLTVKQVLILPEHWDTGAGTVLLGEIARRAQSKGYRWLDLSLLSADDAQTSDLISQAGGQVYKRYRVYRLAIAELGVA